ncbi:uncharacterized protein LOC107473412 [Arachis duranensis]|uniref:Uncharacterized protein LOC107473412 n=1 Tax=Arachis duranensis TaxID=130453 RepID=A0A6P4CBN0_ARADU|nr:uncharacterized protein LOC107473412 [Arachis duranensis]
MAAKSRQAGLDDIQEEYRKQYKRIGDYCYELLRSNPGSSVTLKVHRSPDFEHEQQHSSLNNYCIFQRLYGAAIDCYRVGPNDQMLPIAYAVVESETKDSWTWFVKLLIDDFGSETIGRATFMSDQQKKEVPWTAIKVIDVEMCKSYTLEGLGREMEVIRGVNVEVHRHLNSIPPRFWSRSRFSFHSKCDTLVNNMCESFNGTIVDSREKPIITMLEEIRVYLMSRWAVNRERIQRFNGTILPRIRKKLERRRRAVGEWRPYWSAAQTYEVVNGLSKYTVDLSLRECSCKKWQLSGIPCTHAISCINFKGLELESYVDDCYKRDAYVKCYELSINPLNGPDLWEHTNFDDVMPPPYRKPSHRPVKKRKRGPDESKATCHTHLSRRGQIQRCSKCGTSGHKRGRCNNPPLPAQPTKQTAAKIATRGMKSSDSKPAMQSATRGRKRSRGQENSSSQTQLATSSTPITRSKSSHS